MKDKVRAVFDMLGVEPNEEFKLSTIGGVVFDAVYIIDEELIVRVYTKERTAVISGFNIFDILNDSVKIIKPPKKKKLRDITFKEYGQWKEKHCKGGCITCLFRYIDCDIDMDSCWINNKDLYSDKFLDQEIEVE